MASPKVHLPLFLEISIPAERIAYAFCAAIEGNSMTRAWCSDVLLAGSWAERLLTPDVIKSPVLADPWYSDPKLWASPLAALRVIEFDESDGKKTSHFVDYTKLRRGLRIMAEQHGRHFGDFMAEEGDGVTADVFLQCIALGKVVYG